MRFKLDLLNVSFQFPLTGDTLNRNAAKGWEVKKSGYDITRCSLCDTVLSERILSKIDEIKRKIPDVQFSSDIIVGFPGETNDEFNKTYVEYNMYSNVSFAVYLCVIVVCIEARSLI